MGITILYSSTKIPPYRLSPFRCSGPEPKIGILAPHYGLARVSYAMSPQGYQFVSLRRWPLHRLDYNSSFLNNTAILTNPSVDLVHTMNMLPMNGERFVVSCELELPRYLEKHRPWQHQLGHELLRSERCRQILALSEISARLLRQQYQASGMPDIVRKISVFRGSVLPSSSAECRQYSEQGPLKLLFVGGEAFRKGLVSVLAAIKQLRAGGLEAELTVVSSLELDDYISGDAAPEPKGFRQSLQALPWVIHHQALPNQQVRQLMRQHDLLLIPSFDETLGWVIIEAGMEGLGAIATDVFAFSELIEDGVTGRMLSLPKNEQNRWHGVSMPAQAYPQAWVEDTHQLTIQLAQALEACVNNRALAHIWGEAAYHKMMALYHPAPATEQLAQIYREALAS